MQPDDPDVRLMLAFRDGDDSALSDLYRRWAGPLLRFLERMVKERATAEELLQESFIRVHGARDRYEPEARFSTWLFRIARNLALNELDLARRKKIHLSTDVERSEDDQRPQLTLVSSAPSAESVIDARRKREVVEACLADLPERQRSALWLSAVEGHSYAEIAEVLETSTQSVKSLIHRARVAIADRVDAALSGSAATSRTAGNPDTAEAST
jgi:RNA polymerase sigma-70 factor (ECF subfamily)